MSQTKNITLVLDNLRSVFNTASLFRTAECFGISEIVLCGTTPCPTDRFGRIRADFAKVSLGAEGVVPWKYFHDTEEAVSSLKNDGCYIISLEQSDSSVILHSQVSAPDRCALVVGNEVDGVQKKILNVSEVVWEIEQFGEKESLNVCIAGSIALYHLRFIVGGLS